jgi:hypothetical protein
MRLNLKDCSPALQKRIQDAIRNQDRATLPIANMEPPACHEQVAAGKGAPLRPPISVHVHSVRKRLTDADGVSAKAAIDGLVHAGILHGDDPSNVKEVSYSQEKGAPEKTIITLTANPDGDTHVALT